MTGKANIKQQVSPWDLSSDLGYAPWRAEKLYKLSQAGAPRFISVQDLANLSPSECDSLVSACKTSNAALYETPQSDLDSEQTRLNLRGFSDRLGLRIAENHRSAGNSGIVALTVTDAPKQRGYIPYTRKSMNWHTDGYYNAKDNQIRAMVLHCVQPAGDGGQNQLLDPEVAYIRLRDENPDYITALMHPSAMTIPENLEADGSLRPVSTGPVFAIDPANDTLSMRYTARSRSIAWRDDATTKAAVGFLQDLLENGDPLMQTVTLKAGQGLLCNNILHNRTGFDPDRQQDSKRMIFRIRFHNRVSGS